MTENEKWERVEQSLSLTKTTMENIDSIFDMIGLYPESKLAESVFTLHCEFIRGIELLIGDDQDNISWYVFENDYGKRKLECCVGGKTRKIKNIKDLRWLIESSNKVDDIK